MVGDFHIRVEQNEVIGNQLAQGQVVALGKSGIGTQLQDSNFGKMLLDVVDRIIGGAIVGQVQLKFGILALLDFIQEILQMVETIII